MIRIAIAAIAIVLALAGATFSLRAQGASCLTLAQAKIETAQWQAVKVIEPVKIRTVAVEPAARERFDVVFYGGADRLQFERRWIRWVDQTRDEIAGGLYAGARLGALSPPRKGVDRVANKVDLPTFDALAIQPLRPTMGRTSSLGDTWRRTHSGRTRPRDPCRS